MARSVAGEAPATQSTPLASPLDDTAGGDGLVSDALHHAVSRDDPVIRRAITSPAPVQPARVPRPGANTYVCAPFDHAAAAPKLPPEKKRAVKIWPLVPPRLSRLTR